MVGEHEAMTFDYWAALWSLPAALGITLANLPAPSRFLQTRAEDGSLARTVVAVAAEGQTRSSPAVHSSAVRGEPAERRALRIGLALAGQFAGQDKPDGERSIPQRPMQRLVRHPDHTWVSLQHGAPPTRHRKGDRLDGGHGGVHPDGSTDRRLDPVISIDTGAAHLAAALGAKTWGAAARSRRLALWHQRRNPARGRLCACSGRITRGAMGSRCSQSVSEALRCANVRCNHLHP